MDRKEKGSNFMQQAAILAAASIISRFIGFLYRIPLTDILGDLGNGYYSQGYYIYTFFLIFSSAGLPAAISKMVSTRATVKQYRDAHRVFEVSLIIGGALGLFCSLLLSFGARAFAGLINTPEAAYTMLTLSPTIFIVTIMSSYRGYFQGLKNSVPTAVSQLVEQIVNAVFTVALAWQFSKTSIAAAAAGGTAGTGIGAFAGLAIIIVIYNMAKPKIIRRVKLDRNREDYESDFSIVSELIKTAVPIIIGTAVFSLTNIIDIFMVKNILINSGYTPVQADELYGQLSGKYYVITTLPVTISTSLATAALPSIASSFKLRDLAAVHKKTNSAMRIAMILTIPAAVGIGILGTPILELLFPKHSGGGVLLQVGSISILFLALTQISTGMLQGIGRVKVPAFAALCGALLKIPLNYIFISIHELNVTGSVISTIFCYFLAAAIDVYFLIKYTNVKLDFATILIKPMAAAAVMGVACYTFYHSSIFLTENNTISVIISILISIFAYFTMLLLLRGLQRDDIIELPFGSKICYVLEQINML
ncbi:MAG: polysaccharide biosynthesis protein [Clostridiales bacterium]|jgi:stage V sporulation protein B|nr:polysaccharide biosynthesis protein [Clostridiales bacterium]